MTVENEALLAEEEKYEDDLDDTLELDNHDDNPEKDEKDDSEEQDETTEETDEESETSGDHDTTQLSRRDQTRKKRWESSIDGDTLDYNQILDHAKDPFLMKYIDRFATSQGYEDGSELIQEAMAAAGPVEKKDDLKKD